MFASVCVLSKNYTVPALLYTALHGAYGLNWCLKYITTPDKSFEVPIASKGEFIFSFLILGALYWIPGIFMIATGGSNIINNIPIGLPATNEAIMAIGSGNPYSIQIAVAVFLCTIGTYLHYVSDAQKFWTLKYRRGLITEGLFARSRNINYLGEILIYAGFALVVNNGLLLFSNVTMWLTLFRANMLKKDESLSRYKDFETYKKRSNLLFPKIFSS